MGCEGESLEELQVMLQSIFGNSKGLKLQDSLKGRSRSTNFSTRFDSFQKKQVVKDTTIKSSRDPLGKVRNISDAFGCGSSSSNSSDSASFKSPPRKKLLH